MDGLALGNFREARAGAVLLDNSGEVIFALEFYLGQATNMQAEIQALVRRLRTCHGMGFYRILIESDSKTLVNFLCGLFSWPWSRRIFSRLEI